MKLLLIACMLMMVGCGGATGDVASTAAPNQTDSGEFPDVSGVYRLLWLDGDLCSEVDYTSTYEIRQEGNELTLVDTENGSQEIYTTCFYDLDAYSIIDSSVCGRYAASLRQDGWVAGITVYYDRGMNIMHSTMFGDFCDEHQCPDSRLCLLGYHKTGGMNFNSDVCTVFSNAWMDTEGRIYIDQDCSFVHSEEVPPDTMETR